LCLIVIFTAFAIHIHIFEAFLVTVKAPVLPSLPTSNNEPLESEGGSIQISVFLWRGPSSACCLEKGSRGKIGDTSVSIPSAEGGAKVRSIGGGEEGINIIISGSCSSGSI
jgi:hypothetical protein